ncbi:MAG: Uma2 family endonuclease [Myxococcales bacterium]|nr:Uma2 family endonuclease [Myxococcales bacterium]
MVMHATALKRRVTLAEYLAFEEAAEEKHILWDGEIFPMWGMAGALPAHNVIAGNAYAALHTALRDRGCRPFNSDQKIWVPLKGGVVYPDVSVVCGKAALHTGTRDTFDNPVAVVEVLSPGTEAFDRSEKFEGYRSVETLRDYVMLASGDAHAEHYARGSDGGWTLREYRAGGVFSLSSVEVVLRVDELYEGAFDVTDAG